MQDVMLDLETFGSNNQACIVQIGACFFDRYTGAIGNQFKVNVDAYSAVKLGAVMDAATIYWWLEREPRAIASILAEPREPLNLALESFVQFLRTGSVKQVWSHATFDFVIISDAFKKAGIKMPFPYSAARDIRTLVDLADVSHKKTPRDGVHHDALDDCIYQVKYCVEAFRALKK